MREDLGRIYFVDFIFRRSTLIAVSDMYFPGGIRYQRINRYFVKPRNTNRLEPELNKGFDLPFHLKWTENGPFQERDAVHRETTLYRNTKPSKRDAGIRPVNNSPIYKAMPTAFIHDQCNKNSRSERDRGCGQVQRHQSEQFDHMERNIFAEAWISEQLDGMDHLSANHDSPSTYAILFQKLQPFVFHTD